MGIGLGECCCTPAPPSWSPPAPVPGECEYDFCCEGVGTPASFTIELVGSENDVSCYINCESCSTTPFDLVLSPTSGTWPYISGCSAALEASLTDLSSWFLECNDTCVYQDYYGTVTLERECEADIDGVLCTEPPADGFIATSVVTVTVFLRLFRDCCVKMVIFNSAYPSSGGSVKVDPTDPNTTVDPFGCWLLNFKTYEGTATCCGDFTVSEAAITASCTASGYGGSGCSAVCQADLNSTTITMDC